MDASRVAALVLAAGTSSRFGSPKLLAVLEGRPLLDHVLAVGRDIGFRRTVVVLGREAAAVEATVTWGSERRVVNRQPERGLSSSVRLGLEALADDAAVEAALVLLGDQPAVRPEVIEALLAHDVTPERPVVVPRYAADGARNPVLLGRAAWGAAAEVTGDRGFGPWLDAHRELVAVVEVPGMNPDVDTPADLAALAWARRVVGNREQVDRLREVPEWEDYYSATTSSFRGDPHREQDESLSALLELARPDETWLDVGAGAGRYAIPLAMRVREVIAVEPSPSMRAAFAEDAEAAGVTNVRVIDARWPMEDPPSADVALIANLGYDIEAIGPFLDGLEAAARRLCVALLRERTPATAAGPYWEAVHGEPRVELPALHEFVDLLRARGREPHVRMVTLAYNPYPSFEALMAFLRRQTWVREGSEKDRKLVAMARERAARAGDGWLLQAGPPQSGLVTWEPR